MQNYKIIHTVGGDTIINSDEAAKLLKTFKSEGVVIQKAGNSFLFLTGNTGIRRLEKTHELTDDQRDFENKKRIHEQNNIKTNVNRMSNRKKAKLLINGFVKGVLDQRYGQKNWHLYYQQKQTDNSIGKEELYEVLKSAERLLANSLRNLLGDFDTKDLGKFVK